jgi:DNA-binding response OmpR family regulator
MIRRLLPTRTVDTHILRLRQKLEADPERPRYILTVHGQGYKLAAPEPGERHEAAS